MLPSDMPEYCAFLGHQPHISIAELSAAIPGFSLITTVDGDVAIFSSTEKVHPGDFSFLGGSISLAEEAGGEGTTTSDIPQILLRELQNVRGKVTFGLRTRGIPRPMIREMYRRYKDTLKKAGRPSRYVGNERKPAPAALLKDAGMLSGKHGCELTVIQLPDRLWVGRTIAAQDVDAYTLRDMKKPVRDTTVGLLPPKLAQVMLNLGLWLHRQTVPQATKTHNAQPRKAAGATLTVLDPFCGTGVIPVECLVRGWNVLASDCSLKAVNGCTKNIEWARKTFKILKKDVSSKVWKQDATKPFSLQHKPDMIVTETSLGPPLTKAPSQRNVRQLVKDAEELEEAFLRNIAQSLPGIPVVCMWPFWRLRGGELARLEQIWDKLHAIGYIPMLPPGVPPSGRNKLSLLYRRHEQMVGRELLLLQPRAVRS